MITVIAIVLSTIINIYLAYKLHTLKSKYTDMNVKFDYTKQYVVELEKRSAERSIKGKTNVSGVAE